jgi:hypothetical protein
MLDRYFILVLIILLPLVVFAGDPSSEKLPGKLDYLEEAIQKAIHDLEIFESNGFSIKTYKANEIGPPPEFKIEKRSYSAVRIKSEQTPSFTIELNRHNKNSFGFAVFHSQTNEPIIFIGDKDGDGKFDDLVYTVMADNGKGIMQIIDYGMDGTADTSSMFQQNINILICSYFEIFPSMNNWL